MQYSNEVNNFTKEKEEKEKLMIDRVEINTALNKQFNSRFKRIRFIISIILTAVVCKNMFNTLNNLYLVDDLVRLVYYTPIAIVIYGDAKNILNLLEVCLIHINHKGIYALDIIISSVVDILAIVVLIDRLQLQSIQDVLFIVIAKEIIIDLLIMLVSKISHVGLKELEEV